MLSGQNQCDEGAQLTIVAVCEITQRITKGVELEFEANHSKTY